MTSIELPDPAAGTPGLRVGRVPGVTLTKWSACWAERFRELPLVIVEVAEADQGRVLAEHLVDACFVRLPLNVEGLHVVRVYDEVAVVVAPKDHPVAAYDEIALADLAGEPILDAAEPDAFDRVAFGQGVVCVPHAIARSHNRRDLISRPITDAEPTTIALAWRVDAPDDLIQEFVGIVRGRTVNSSRTTASLPGKSPDAAARGASTKARTPKGAPRSGSSVHPGRRRRGR
jgi:DNA-binding transcriptional LysR family regulator